MAGKLRKGKKRWITIVGPREFRNNILGESYVIDPDMLIGKKIKLNLSNLVGDMRKQNFLMGFKINEIKGAEAHAHIVSYEMVQAHTRRLVRVGRDKIDDSFIVESKDKLKIRIKPIALTRHKANNSVLSKIRLDAREKIKRLFLENNFNQVLSDIISGRLQRSMRQELSKIYPLSVFDIRKVEILNR